MKKRKTRTYIPRISAAMVSFGLLFMPITAAWNPLPKVYAATAAYTTDASFEAYLTQQGFPESYKPGLRALHAQYPNWVFQAYQTGLDWNTAVSAELQGTSSLVESSAKSSWKSTEDGKFDWTTSTWPGFDGATWVGASREIVAYFMDPRNFLDDSYIFQFAVHSYDANLQTLAGLQSMLQGTFLEGSVAIDASSPLYTAALQSTGGTVTSASSANMAASVTGTAAETVQSGSGETWISYDGPGAGSSTLSTGVSADTGMSSVVEGTDSVTAVGGGPGSDSTAASAASTAAVQSAGTETVTVSYAEILMEAAQQSQVSPYMLAAMILQEQGSKGSSNSISGASGYYNYFNVGAYAANGMTAVERGLWYASQSGSYNRPWNTPERAIVGGALFYAGNYLASGQNTLYLKRFNVQGSNMFKHQYMTNVEGAASEGKNLGKAYTESMRAGAQVFSIPVYSGMPETACPQPTKDGNPNNKLKSLTVDGYTLTPSFSLDTTAYTLVVDPSVNFVNVSAAAYHSAAGIAGTGTISLDSATKTVTVTVTAENGDQRNYQITISKAAGGQAGAADTAVVYSNVQTGADTQTTTVGASPTGSNTSVIASSDVQTAPVVAVSSGPM